MEIILILITLGLYVLPSIIAANRFGEDGRGSRIAVTNLLLGWTGVLWFLFMAYVIVAKD